MRRSIPGLEHARPPSYGTFSGKVQKALCGALIALAATFFAHTPAPAAPERPVKIVALGDSLTAGFGLSAGDAFPTKLAAALKAKGIAATVANAGVSGDTASGGLDRLDWSVPPDTDAVILELGANDMLRGVDPAVTRGALETIMRRLRERHIAILICGMLAAPNLGTDYRKAFDGIYPDLARAYGALYYPFFLQGVATVSGLNQPDGLHPTAAGVDVIVERILPSVEQLVRRAREARAS